MVYLKLTCYSYTIQQQAFVWFLTKLQLPSLIHYFYIFSSAQTSLSMFLCYILKALVYELY
jgi:hypothetical protein